MAGVLQWKDKLTDIYLVLKNKECQLGDKWHKQVYLEIFL